MPFIITHIAAEQHKHHQNRKSARHFAKTARNDAWWYIGTKRKRLRPSGLLLSDFERCYFSNYVWVHVWLCIYLLLLSEHDISHHWRWILTRDPPQHAKQVASNKIQLFDHAWGAGMWFLISRFLGPTQKMSRPAYQSPALRKSLAGDGWRCLGTNKKHYALVSRLDRVNKGPGVDLPVSTSCALSKIKH